MGFFDSFFLFLTNLFILLLLSKVHQIHQIDFIDIFTRRAKYKGTVHKSTYNNGGVNTMKNNIKIFKILV